MAGSLKINSQVLPLKTCCFSKGAQTPVSQAVAPREGNMQPILVKEDTDDQPLTFKQGINHKHGRTRWSGKIYFPARHDAVPTNRF
jgi:hypothetical protein